ncbi:hypothetical protein AB0H12_41755 [Actinosynnema sp. NPDC023794]
MALLFSAVAPTATATPTRTESAVGAEHGQAYPVVTFAKAEKATADAAANTVLDSAASTCPVTAYGYNGYTYCDFTYSTLD